MQRARFYFPVVICFLASLALSADKPRYIHFSDFNWPSVVPPPPQDGSPQQQAEIATLLDWQAKRTPAQVARCKAEASATGFYFARVLGPHFDEHDLPITGELLHQAFVDAQGISERIKRQWNRRRPYVADPRVNPCVTLEKSPSYPSGHAERGIVWATILSEIYPEKKVALMAAGRQLGEDRVVAGIHYPSDVAAGQKLGGVVAEKLLANPEYQKELEKAKEECMAEAR